MSRVRVPSSTPIKNPGFPCENQGFFVSRHDGNRREQSFAFAAKAPVIDSRPWLQYAVPLGLSANYHHCSQPQRGDRM